MLNFALAGNPNSGKTTLFNALTGSTAHVGNWPGVTVDKKEGVYKKLDENVNIIDLPGIYSLSPYTPEEVISRNYILDENPDCIINIVDATNLERNLYLTTQLLEIDVPVVVALNMIDVVEKNNESIDAKALEMKLGVPVVSISALKENNVDELMKRGYEAAKNKRKAHTILEDTNLFHLVNDCRIAFEAIKVNNPLFHAVKLVELDELETKDHPELVHIVEEFKSTFKDEVFGSDFEAIVADSRYKFISKEFANVKKTTVADEKKVNSVDSYSKSDKIDKILTNKWAGIPIFLVILFLIFHLTFSENIFWLGKLINSDSFANSEFFAGTIWHEGGINSPGVILQSLLIGATDFLSSVVASWLSSSASWVSGLIVDGILAGIFAVLSFLPQILLLFLFFSILEDSGYMARIAFIMDRIFRRFGLSGRAFMPMIMGFGCSIPAMINTRTLADDKERTATIRVIPFFSCGAKLPILTAIAGGIVTYFKVGNADVITYSMYLLGITIAVVSVLLMRNTSMRGKVPPFIMELPQYRMPGFKPLMLHLWDKLKHFVKKAFTIILASTIVIWFLQSFTANLRYIDQANPNEIADTEFEELAIENETYKNALLSEEDLEAFDDDGELQVSFSDVMTYYDEIEDEIEQGAFKENVLTPVLLASYDSYVEEINDKDYKDQNDSILAHFGTALTPIFTPMGFGSQLSESGWIFPVSAATGLIAKENVIATFQVLSQASSKVEIEEANTDEEKINAYITLYNIGLDEDGVNAAQATINSTGVNIAGLIAFIAFNMLTIPCFAAVATAKAELPDKKIGKTLVFWLLTSYVVSSMVYLIGTYVWTIAIFASLLAAAITFIVIYNKNHPVYE